MATATTTQDQEEIRRWAEERGGVPAIVKGTGGLLRIDFVEGEGSGGREESLEETTWEEWFRIFEDRGLSFLFVPEDGSRFFRLIRADGQEQDG